MNQSVFEADLLRAGYQVVYSDFLSNQNNQNMFKDGMHA
jgi:hypothetical protein